MSDTKRANPRSYDAERRNEWDKEGVGAHDRKCFTFWPKKRQEARREKAKERKNQKFEIRYCMCLATCL